MAIEAGARRSFMMDNAKGNHTEHMRSTYNGMKTGIDKVKFNDLKIPTISTFDGKAYMDGAQA